MVDKDITNGDETAETATTKRTRRRAASRPAGPPAALDEASAAEPTEKPAKAAAPRKKAVAKKATTAKTTARKSTAKMTSEAPPEAPAQTEVPEAIVEAPATESTEAAPTTRRSRRSTAAPAFVAPVFQEPAATEAADAEGEPAERPVAKRSRRKAAPEPADVVQDEAAEQTESDDAADSDAEGVDEGEEGGKRRRRRRGGRGRKRRNGEDDSTESEDAEAPAEPGAEAGDGDESADGSSRRRRRRRSRGGDADGDSADEGTPTVRSRRTRATSDDDVAGLRGSTRLEAKKQRRREGREAGRRRAPILTEAEFLARRESVDRVMVVRQKNDRTQIAVLEDGVLVEHYVTRGTSSSMVGNVHLGRVQNVLPSMEAAFVDIGRGRNAVLYAGEVNWDAAGLEGQPKRIEFALKSGDSVLVQVTKDPVGQKGARLTSQVSLPGRFLVYVPDGSMTGISRKLPDSERSRLKSILKRVMPEDAGVIVRTAAEGAPEDALEQDVARLTTQWADINAAAKSASPPALLYSEPDLAIKVVRDIFNEDVNKLVVSGSEAWSTVSGYINSVAPDLADRLDHWVGSDDVFAAYRVEEQLLKALDRKVYLPSGGSLVIDRTEAMTVVDVNTGKFTGQGGNLEQTVTRNNLEAAEEIVRQLRLRDIGGIIVVDFIDMVLESNRDLVLRRLIECLGRDRTKHQVAEVTSLGLVQMTRKRIGSGLIESFSETCEACNGRGIKVSLHGDDHAEHSPRYRRPANAVDPADVAARALAAHSHEVEEAVEAALEPEAADLVEVDLVEAEGADVVEDVEAVDVVEAADVAEAEAEVALEAAQG